MAEQPKQLDAYSTAVLRKMDYLLGAPLDPVMAAKLEQALLACQPKHHPIDVRGELQLHFSKYYYVLLMGRDTRTAAATVDKDLRRRSDPAAVAIHWAVALWPLYILIYFGISVFRYFPKLAGG